MKAMLLSAGLGTRLRPWTETTPKCMVPVAGKPTLLRAIEWLRTEGVTELAVNLHHLPRAVTEYCRDGRSLGVRIRYSYEPELLGTAGAVDACRDWLDGGLFLVVYADNIMSCDLGAFRRLHESSGATLTVALHWRRDVVSSGLAELAADGRITAFAEKPAGAPGQGGWVNAGLLLCEPGVLGFIPRGSVSDFGRNVLPALLEAGERVIGYRMGAREFLYWIDTPPDLARAEALLREQGEAA